MGRGRGERMLGKLVAASHLMALEQLPGVVAEHAADAGLDDVLIYVVDLQQNVLRLLNGLGAGDRAGPTDDRGGPGGDRVGPDGDQVGPGGEEVEIRVDGTLAGRAFQSVHTVAGHALDDRACHHWVPILDGTERLGVLRVTAGRDDEAALQDAEDLAGLIALIIVSKGPASDSFSRLVRRDDMTVSAEMQWRLMPPLTFATDRVVIGAALEPAYKLGGDTFDYALAGDRVFLGVFDAMGHDTAAGLSSNLAVAACRNSRLRGGDLAEAGRAIEEVLLEQDRSGRFVTAVLAELDLGTGMLTWVSYGHPPPVVIRGGRWVTTLDCPPATPLGTGLGVAPTLCREQLEPGDRLLLYTDGIVEARDPDKREFGLARFVDFIVRRNADGLPVPETLRRLINSILDHHAGRLDDDATVLALEWRGTAPSGSAIEGVTET